MEMIEKGELEQGKIWKRLDGFLTREIERKLFNLPVKNEQKAGKVAVKSKPTKS